MQPSSFVFVAIVALWAAYLLPQWIRRRDALGASRGSDRHSLALRVLERRRRRRRPGPSSAPLLARSAGPAPVLPTPSSALPLGMPASPVRSAARRQANILAVLAVSTALATAGSVAGVIPGALVLIPAGLLLADVVALRVARRARSAAAVTQAAPAGAGVRRARPMTPVRRVASTAPAASAPVLPRAPDAAEAVAESLASEPDDDRTWVPVPVPPPTYTLKPMAPRAEPAPLETGVPAARGSGSRTLPERPWVSEEPADVDLDSVLQRRRAVNG